MKTPFTTPPADIVHAIGEAVGRIGKDVIVQPLSLLLKPVPVTITVVPKPPMLGLRKTLQPGAQPVPPEVPRVNGEKEAVSVTPPVPVTLIVYCPFKEAGSTVKEPVTVPSLFSVHEDVDASPFGIVTI